jgi:hypothetical protein
MNMAWSFSLDGNNWVNEKWIRLPLALPTSINSIKLVRPGTQKH